jgi:transaldolase
MRIFLATTNLDEIRWALDHGFVDGVLTTPGLFAEQPYAEPREVIAEICRLTSTIPVMASVGGVSDADVYRDGRELARISDQLVVQIPFVEDAIGAMKRLAAEGVHVAATLVFNAAQALLAAKVGASVVSAHIDDLDALGEEGVEVVREIRGVFDVHSVECDVLAALPRTSSQFTGCARAGADAIALAPETLRALLLHPLTDRGLDQLLHDLSRRHPARMV